MKGLKWWTENYGPKLLLKNILSAFTEKKSLHLHTEKVFFSNDFFNHLETLLKHNISNSVELHEIDITSLIDVNGIADKLIDTFSKDSNKHYRHDIPRLKHLKKYKLLENKLVTIRINDENQLKNIHQFLIDYGDSSFETGLFLLLTTKNFNAGPVHSLIVIDSNNFINNFEIQLFISNEISSINPNGFDNFYLSNLHFYIGLENLDKAFEILDSYDFSIVDPLSNDILFIKSEQKENLIWQAQARSFLSRIELLRIKLITKHSEIFTKAISFNHYFGKNGRLNEFPFLDFNEQRITNVYDLEYSHLFYMTKLRFKGNHDFFSSPFKIISNKALILDIEFLRETRNRLAHCKTLTLLEIKRFLEIETEYFIGQ
jgi:hypothetical protein